MRFVVGCRRKAASKVTSLIQLLHAAASSQDRVRFVFGYRGHDEPEVFSLAQLLPARCVMLAAHTAALISILLLVMCSASQVSVYIAMSHVSAVLPDAAVILQCAYALFSKSAHVN